MVLQEHDMPVPEKWQKEIGEACEPMNIDNRDENKKI